MKSPTDETMRQGRLGFVLSGCPAHHLTSAPALTTNLHPSIAHPSSTQPPTAIYKATLPASYIPATQSNQTQSTKTYDKRTSPLLNPARSSHHIQPHQISMKLSQILPFVFLATSSVTASALPESNALDLLEAHGASVPRSELLSPDHALEKRKGGGGKGGGGGGGTGKS
jgi:hypothetical protein